MEAGGMEEKQVERPACAAGLRGSRPTDHAASGDGSDPSRSAGCRRDSRSARPTNGRLSRSYATSARVLEREGHREGDETDENALGDEPVARLAPLLLPPHDRGTVGREQLLDRSERQPALRTRCDVRARLLLAAVGTVHGRHLHESRPGGTNGVYPLDRPTEERDTEKGAPHIPGKWSRAPQGRYKVVPHEASPHPLG